MKKKNTHNDLGFKVPKDYFESSVDRLFDTVKGLQERPDVPFSVPSSYFESLEESIMSAVDANKDQQYHRITPFEVPQDYFETLENRVMNSITTSDESRNATPFTIPQDYFEKLEQRVLDATVDKPVAALNNDYPAWVLPMLAVAAIFVAVLAIDGFWPNNTMTIEDLDSEEIELYLAETNFTADEDAIDILFADTDILDVTQFETSIDNEELLDYLTDEVDMNQMIEE